MNADPDKFIAFELDGELRPIREISLSDSLKTGLFPVSDFMKFDFAPDGKTIFYLHELEGLRRLDQTTGEDQLLYRTEMEPDNPLHTIGTLRLIDRGETILFFGGTYDLNPDLPVSRPHFVYGLMSPEGEILKTVDPAELEVPFKSDAIRPVYPYIPQSSPVALLVPSDPIPEVPTFYIPPPKSVYAWHTKTDEIVEIPLPVSWKAENSVLSENGSYLASGMCESRDDGTSAFVARLYDTGSGEALSRVEISGLADCYTAQTAVSEADRIIRAIYRENGIAYYAEIPF